MAQSIVTKSQKQYDAAVTRAQNAETARDRAFVNLQIAGDKYAAVDTAYGEALADLAQAKATLEWAKSAPTFSNVSTADNPNDEVVQ